MRNYNATHNMCAVSSMPENNLNEVKDINYLLLASLDDIPNITESRQPNTNEQTGDEEPTMLYRDVTRFEMPLNFERAQAQHFAFLLGFALGGIDGTFLGGCAEHLITPIAGDYDTNRANPSFTVKARTGNTVAYNVYAGVCVDEITATFSKDSYASINARLKGTGCVHDALIREERTFHGDTDIILDLSSKPILDGAIENVHKVEVFFNNAWHDVSFSEGDPNSLNVQSIEGMQSDEDYEYRIYYLSESAANIAGDMPASPIFETPLFVSDFSITAGGTWDGTQFVGGHKIDADLTSLEYTIQNNLSFETGFNASGKHANRVYREGRTQKIKVDKLTKDLLLYAWHKYNETFGFYIAATGDTIPGTSERYKLEFIFPKVGFLSHSNRIDNKNNAENMELNVLKSSQQPSVIAKVTTLFM